MCVSYNDINKRIDADILRGKVDILRAHDIIPGSPLPEAEKSQQQAPPNQTPPGRQIAEVPKFDLAEDIMAEQRRITAFKRKPPGKKDLNQSRQPQAEPAERSIRRLIPHQLEQDEIIVDIVARDIKRLCGA